MNFSTFANETAAALRTQNDSFRDKFAAIERQLMDVAQQKAAHPGIAGMTMGGSPLASKLMNDPALAAWKSGDSRLAGRISVEFNPLAEIKTITSGTPVGGPMAQADRVPGIVPASARPRWLWQYLPMGVATTNAVEFLRETGDTKVAGTQASEGAQKPETSFSFELVQAPVETIAHYSRVSKQAFADSPALQSFLRDRLMEGAWRRLEYQMINGTGSNTTMSGILSAGSHMAYTPVSTLKPVDQIRRAISVLQGKDFQPSLLVLNPADWYSLEVSRASGSGEYDFAEPSVTAAPQLWSLPIHVTNDLPVGQFIVMDTAATNVWMRESAQLLLSDSDGDQFVRNVLTALCELRCAFAVTRPEAVLAGPLGA